MKAMLRVLDGLVTMTKNGGKVKRLPPNQRWMTTVLAGVLSGATLACGDSTITEVATPNRIVRQMAVSPPAPIQQRANVCADGPAGTYTFSISETDPNNVGTLLVGPTFTLTNGECKPVASSNSTRFLMTVSMLVTPTGAPLNAVLNNVTKTQWQYASLTDTNPVPTTTTETGPGVSFTIGLERAADLIFNFVGQAPSLQITKSAANATVDAGSDIGFSITVSSNGPGTAAGVVLNDALPAGNGISWSLVQAVAGCSIQNNTLTCNFGDLAAGQTRTVELTSPTTTGSCGIYNNTASATATNHATVQASASTTVNCPPPPPGGGEGCTPGYWKQTQHFGNWTAPYTPNTLFSAVFEDAFPGMTLLQVLGQGGGGLNALGRHTVAALLNGANSNVSADLSAQQVIDAFNAVFPSGDIDGLHTQLAGFNEQGCPLGRNP